MASIIIVSFFCSSCGKSEREKQKTESVMEQTLEKGTEVFIDTSKSMRGFFRTTAEQTSVIQRFFKRELRNTISENNLIPLFVSMFAGKIPIPQEIQDNIGNLFIFESDKHKKKFFSGESTDLLGVFTKEGFGKHSLSIIITDGIHSGSDGFDIGEMIRAIETKIKDEKMYISLIGIKSEYDYLVFPVITPDAERFWYKGYRPIYIWLATHDAEMGDKVTKDLILKMKKVMGIENGSQDITLKSICFNNISSPDVSNIEIESDRSYYVYVKDRELRLLRKTKEVDKIDIPLKIIKKSDVIGDYWKLSLRLESEVKGATLFEKDGDWNLSLTYSQLPQKIKQFTIKVVAVPDRQQYWWRQWSTDIDAHKENADKTLYLDRLGIQVIEPHCSKERELQSMVLDLIKM